MTNKNLATKNTTDFTVLPTGDAYIRTKNIDVKQGVSAENL